MWTNRRSKRNQMLAWFVLLGAQAGTAALPWIWVVYSFGEQTKQLTLSGFDSWPTISGQIMFGLAGFAVVGLTRGLPRRVSAWAVAALSWVLTISTLSNLPGAFGNRVPAAVNTLVEKASGIAGGGANDASAAITSHVTLPTIALAFALASVLLSLLQVGVALTVGEWAKNEKRDKYAKAAKPTDGKAAKATKTGKATKKTKSGKPAKGDNISLWDSQR